MKLKMRLFTLLAVAVSFGGFGQATITNPAENSVTIEQVTPDFDMVKVDASFAVIQIQSDNVLSVDYTKKGTENVFNYQGLTSNENALAFVQSDVGWKPISRTDLANMSNESRSVLSDHIRKPNLNDQSIYQRMARDGLNW